MPAIPPVRTPAADVGKGLPAPGQPGAGVPPMTLLPPQAASLAAMAAAVVAAAAAAGDAAATPAPEGGGSRNIKLNIQKHHRFAPLGITVGERLRWSPELHKHFVTSVQKLGGPSVAKVRAWGRRNRSQGASAPWTGGLEHRLGQPAGTLVCVGLD